MNTIEVLRYFNLKQLIELNLSESLLWKILKIVEREPNWFISLTAKEGLLYFPSQVYYYIFESEWKHSYQTESEWEHEFGSSVNFHSLLLKPGWKNLRLLPHAFELKDVEEPYYFTSQEGIVSFPNEGEHLYNKTYKERGFKIVNHLNRYNIYDDYNPFYTCIFESGIDYETFIKNFSRACFIMLFKKWDNSCQLFNTHAIPNMSVSYSKNPDQELYIIKNDVEIYGYACICKENGFYQSEHFSADDISFREMWYSSEGKDATGFFVTGCKISYNDIANTIYDNSDIEIDDSD